VRLQPRLAGLAGHRLQQRRNGTHQVGAQIKAACSASHQLTSQSFHVPSAS
jgi:hypothetical protein